MQAPTGGDVEMLERRLPPNDGGGQRPPVRRNPGRQRPHLPPIQALLVAVVPARRRSGVGAAGAGGEEAQASMGSCGGAWLGPAQPGPAAAADAAVGCPVLKCSPEARVEEQHVVPQRGLEQPKVRQVSVQQVLQQVHLAVADAHAAQQVRAQRLLQARAVRCDDVGGRVPRQAA